VEWLDQLDRAERAAQGNRAAERLAAQPGWAWAPVDRWTQEGGRHPQCGRALVARLTERLAAAGLTARLAFEVNQIIGQRELRNHNAEIMRRVHAGESFTVTRNGMPVSDLVAHQVGQAARQRTVDELQAE
jgi:antitoxin (DNA-binding transcriptional repressor) of toxin-antitoxin stability system